FVRGSIAVGDLYIDNNVAFGPALLNAIDGEKAADFPRIILHESSCKVLDAIRESNEIPKVVLQDSDGSVFLDYLENTIMIAFPDDCPFKEFLREHKFQIEKALKEFTSVPGIRRKYVWTAEYHNAFCLRYP